MYNYIVKTIFLTILTFVTSLTLNAKYITPKEDNTPINSNVSMVEAIDISNVSPVKVGKSTTVVSTSTGWWTYPSTILNVTRNGNDLLVLVNKKYKLPSDYVPEDLVNASQSGIKNGSSYMLRKILIGDLKNLVSDALSDGITLSMVSGYRSYSTQVSTYNYWLSVNNGNVDATDKISARPGHSQHQLGTTVDFSSTEIASGSFSLFKDTLASKWLYNNAWKYGFVISYPYGYESITGYSYESWHYRYIGKVYASEMHSRGIILELYLEGKN